MLPYSTSEAIREFLAAECQRYIDENLQTGNGAVLKPFHARLMPVPFVTWSTLSERSFSTRSGSWFQEIARLVATAYHVRAEKNYLVKGSIRTAAEAHIQAVLADMDHGTPMKRLPDRRKDIGEVLAVQGAGGSSAQTRSDLFVETTQGTELYFEIKTTQPNKDTSVAMKRQILLISALRYAHRAEAFAATAYNPFGDRSPYTWNYANQFLQANQDFLIGRDFWSKIGEMTTYDELLALATKVGVAMQTYLSSRAGGEP